MHAETGRRENKEAHHARIIPQLEKPRGPCGPGLLFNSGNFLLSHTLARAVPSGLRGLTSVFGMGTGVTPSLESPKTCVIFEKVLNTDGQLDKQSWPL